MLFMNQLCFLMLAYFLGPLHNMSVRTVARSHEVVGAASPIQLKPWTKPVLLQIDTTQENLLNIILENSFLLETWSYSYHMNYH